MGDILPTAQMDERAEGVKTIESNSILSTTEGDEPLSTSLDPDISDVLFGLCPEDLSFSFHTTSHEQTLSPIHLPELPKICSSKSELAAQVARWSSPGETHTTETFFGLPMKVKECLKEYHNIDQLYGNPTALYTCSVVINK